MYVPSQRKLNENYIVDKTNILINPKKGENMFL